MYRYIVRNTVEEKIYQMRSLREGDDDDVDGKDEVVEIEEAQEQGRGELLRVHDLVAFFKE